MKPVLLNLDEDMIGNLLIVSKPRAIRESQTREQAYNKVASALDIDFCAVSLIRKKELVIYN